MKERTAMPNQLVNETNSETPMVTALPTDDRLMPLANCEDDNSWATPVPKASLKAKVAVGVLAGLFAMTIGFVAGAKVGKDRAQTSGAGAFAARGFGRNGAFPGFGGQATAGAPTASEPTASAPTAGAATVTSPAAGSDATTATTAPPLAGLLPDLGPTAEALPATDDSPAPASIVGNVVRVDGAEVVVTDQTGAEVRISTKPDTAVSRKAAGSLADLKPGDAITVETDPSSGSDVVASRITVEPAA